MNKLNRPGIYEDALLNNIVTAEDGEYAGILEWIGQNITTNKEFVANMTYMKKILGPKFIKINVDRGISQKRIPKKTLYIKTLRL